MELYIYIVNIQPSSSCLLRCLISTFVLLPIKRGSIIIVRVFYFTIFIDYKNCKGNSSLYITFKTAEGDVISRFYKIGFISRIVVIAHFNFINGILYIIS